MTFLKTFLFLHARRMARAGLHDTTFLRERNLQKIVILCVANASATWVPATNMSALESSSEESVVNVKSELTNVKQQKPSPTAPYFRENPILNCPRDPRQLLPRPDWRHPPDKGSGVRNGADLILFRLRTNTRQCVRF